MFYARVIGSLWATRKDDHLTGKKLLILQPLTFGGKPSGQPIIAVDSIGAGVGEQVVYVTSSEAVIPMNVPMAPVDASVVGITDRIDLGR